MKVCASVPLSKNNKLLSLTDLIGFVFEDLVSFTKYFSIFKKTSSHHPLLRRTFAEFLLLKKSDTNGLLTVFSLQQTLDFYSSRSVIK